MFPKDLDDKLTAHGPLSGPPPEQWEQFKTLMTELAKLTIGPKKKVHQDWFNKNYEHIKELLDDKKKVSIEWQNDISSISKLDRFKHLQRQAQTTLRRMQDEWWEMKADEIETYADTKNSKMFFSPIKEVYGPTKPRKTPLLSADGSTLLKEKSSINARWREHISTLLNRLSTVDPTVLDQIPQKPVITSLDFKYLGSVISSDGSLDKEIGARICKASQALGRLKSRVLNQRNIRQSTKLKVYRTVVLTSLLYGCETSTLYRRHLKQLERFHMRSLRPS